MAINIAAKRGAKEQRRKIAVAQKRKAELEAGSLAGQVRQACAHPLRHCLLSEGLADTAMGMLVVARGETPHSLTVATFLLDTAGLGVKDLFVQSVTGHSFAARIEQMSTLTPMVPVDPAYARKLLRDLVAWARGLGVPPHRDYPKVEPIFGDTNAATCDAEFRFGLGDQPWRAIGAPEAVPLAIGHDDSSTGENG